MAVMTNSMEFSAIYRRVGFDKDVYDVIKEYFLIIKQKYENEFLLIFQIKILA